MGTVEISYVITDKGEVKKQEHGTFPSALIVIPRSSDKPDRVLYEVQIAGSGHEKIGLIAAALAMAAREGYLIPAAVLASGGEEVSHSHGPFGHRAAHGAA